MGRKSKLKVMNPGRRLVGRSEVYRKETVKNNRVGGGCHQDVLHACIKWPRKKLNRKNKRSLYYILKSCVHLLMFRFLILSFWSLIRCLSLSSKVVCLLNDFPASVISHLGSFQLVFYVWILEYWTKASARLLIIQ